MHSNPAMPTRRPPPASPTPELLDRWRQARFLAVDVETTGLSPSRDRVIEVAWVLFEGGRAGAGQASLCRVDVPIPRTITELTRITAVELLFAPTFAEVAPRLLEALSKVDFAVAYNAPFDTGFLGAELARMGARLPPLPFVDPLPWSRRVHPHERVHRLAEVCRRHRVPLDGAHRALADARAAGQLALRLGAALKAPPPAPRASRAPGGRAP